MCGDVRQLTIKEWTTLQRQIDELVFEQLREERRRQREAEDRRAQLLARAADVSRPRGFLV